MRVCAHVFISAKNKKTYLNPHTSQNSLQSKGLYHIYICMHVCVCIFALIST